MDIHPEDIESRSMGWWGRPHHGLRAAREKFPYSIECKNQEKINIWESYKQACDNSKDYEPILFIKRNNHKPLVILTMNISCQHTRRYKYNYKEKK